MLEKLRDFFTTLEIALPKLPLLALRLCLVPTYIFLRLLALFLMFAAFLLKPHSVAKSGSWTSVLVAGMRYTGFLLGLCDDHLSLDFLGPLDRCFVALSLLSGFIFGKHRVSFDVIGRNIFGDMHLKRAVSEGFEQVVLLGAGNDTRLHRLSNLPKFLFEVDAPKSQQFKLDRLRVKNPAVTFVSVNFESESWLQKLESSGFRRTRKSLFIWEGVTMYLTAEAIDATLESIKSCRKGSKVIFDYACYSRPLSRWFIRKMMAFVGEPFRSLFTRTSIITLLEDQHGLKVVERPVKGGDYMQTVAAAKLKRSICDQNRSLNSGLYFVSAVVP